MFRKKPIKLTNWQVPESPGETYYKALNKAIANGDLSDKVKEIGKIREVENIVEDMIQKAERNSGRKINGQDTRQVNLRGIVDDRPKETFNLNEFFRKKRNG